MPHYLYQATYTSDAWAGQLKHPQDPTERVRGVIEGLGGKIIGIWYAFGESDVVAILEMPNNASMAALALAVAAGGAVSSAKTTVLMSVDEGLDAMGKAEKSTYRPPANG